MRKFDNEYAITELAFNKLLTAKSPISGNEYTADFNIEMDLADTMPCFIDMDAELTKLNGEQYSAEALLNVVFNLIFDEYKPFYLKVAMLKNDPAHLPVLLTKEGVKQYEKDE